MRTWLSTRMQKVKPQISERSFFRKKIDENKGNPKGIWKALKSLSGTSKPQFRIYEIRLQKMMLLAMKLPLQMNLISTSLTS